MASFIIVFHLDGNRNTNLPQQTESISVISSLSDECFFKKRAAELSRRQIKNPIERTVKVSFEYHSKNACYQI